MAGAKPEILILGTRGIPAAHGGFETFAERLALFLAERGWHVAVYCQKNLPRGGKAGPIASRNWQGVELIDVEVTTSGPVSSLEFDWLCVRDAAKRPGLCLVLGYNGAVFLPWLRLAGKKILTNMDGIEWKRPKWAPPVKAWFWLNEWIAAWTSQRLVADHPAIADHVATRRNRSAIAMIPYGGVPITEAPEAPVRALGLEPRNYCVSIARIEPDNSILPIVEAFSRRSRGCKLVVLGKFDAANAYHSAVKAAAGGEVLFPGAIYDSEAVAALRLHARAYVHGHTVGGTNPSLVEALWAGNPVIAHDNAYNRWTAGDAAVFFDGPAALDAHFGHFLADSAALGRASAAARLRAAQDFDWSAVLLAYEREALDLMRRPSLRSSLWRQPAANPAQ